MTRGGEAGGLTGSEMTPIVVAIVSPKERDIAMPGVSLSGSQMRCTCEGMGR